MCLFKYFWKVQKGEEYLERKAGVPGLENKEEGELREKCGHDHCTKLDLWEQHSASVEHG